MCKGPEAGKCKEFGGIRVTWVTRTWGAWAEEGQPPARGEFFS